MRHMTSRQRFFGILFAGLVATTLLVTRSGLARPLQEEGVPEPEPEPENVVPGPNGKPKESLVDPLASNGFQLVNSREGREVIESLNAYLTKQRIDWDRVTDAVQMVIDAKTDTFYAPRGPNGQVAGSLKSVKAEVQEMIGTFGKDGRTQYELKFGGRAAELLKKGVQDGIDRSSLSEAMRRYFHTRAGGQAGMILAANLMDDGQYTEAANIYQRLWNRPDASQLFTSRSLFRAAVAFRRSGDTRHAELVPTVWDQLDRSFPRDGLSMGRKVFFIDDLKKELDRGAEAIDVDNSGFIRVANGNAARNALNAGGIPFLDPLFKEPLLTPNLSPEGKEIDDKFQGMIQESLRKAHLKNAPILPGFFPLTAPNLVIYRGFDSVYARTSRDGVTIHGKTYGAAGSLVWQTPHLTQSAKKLLQDPTSRQQTLNRWSREWGNVAPSVLFENTQVGSLSHDGRFVYVIDEPGIPPEQQMQDVNMGFPQPQPRVTNDWNQLVAFDLVSGKRVWELGGEVIKALEEREEDRTSDMALLTQGVVFLGPPLAINNRVYVMYEREGNQILTCFDPVLEPGATSPKRLWSQYLGKTVNSVAANVMRRIQTCHMAYSDGVLVCPTNCGFVVGVDVDAQSLLWAKNYSGYSKVARLNPNNRFNPLNGMPIRHLPDSGNRWRTSVPIISGNKVVFSAYDCEVLLCLDLRTGKEAWNEHRDPNDLFVGGVAEGTVIVVGRNQVRSLYLDPTGKKKPRPWEPVAIGRPCGHGVVTNDGVYYQPMLGTPGSSRGSESSLWAVDMTTGKIRSQLAVRRAGPVDEFQFPLGNLAFSDGYLLSQSVSSVASYPLLETKKREMDELLKKNPEDPVGLVNRGELLLEKGDYKGALSDLLRAEKNKPPTHLMPKVHQKLYYAISELAREDFESAAPHLDRYRKLCEWPTDDQVGAERQKIIEENSRRVGLYCSTMALGREQQGRFVEALDYYLEFARHGANRDLASVQDDLNVQVRPDVWSRRRIDSLLANAQGTARKPLEERISKVAEEVRTSGDPERMKEFILTFGTSSRTGKEMLFAYAETVLNTPENVDRLRDVQSRVQVVRELETDRVSAARLTEYLARILVRRGLLDDAVATYRTFDSLYPDVTLPDGRTGAEIFGDLITDKRLLPYLEPARSMIGGRFKVEIQHSAPQALMNQTIPVRLEGKQLPFFQRHSLQFVQNPQDGMLYSLVVTDKVTGEERCKFERLQLNVHLMSQQFQPAQGRSVGISQFLRCDGHYLLLSAGHILYCFDVVEKKILWQENLLGVNAPPTSANGMPWGHLPAQPTPEGQFQIIMEDGIQLTIGTTILKSTYACFMTRDGLVAVDPSTGRKIWTRRAVSPQAQIFGDGRTICIVEEKNTLVIDAADGTVLKKAKNFSANFQRRRAILGTRILVEDRTKDGITFQLYDPSTDSVLWRVAGSAKAIPVDSADSPHCAILEPDGALTIYDATTGKPVVKSKLDDDPEVVAEHLGTGAAAVKSARLLMDNERFYLFLNRAGDQRPGVNLGMQLRCIPVNGAVHAYDRVTGNLLWSNTSILHNQLVWTERFDESPVLFAAGPIMERGQMKFRFVALDKRTGKSRLSPDAATQWTGQLIQAVNIDQRTRTITYERFDCRVRITPE